MRILHTVQDYSPTGGGMYMVVKQISERLVQKGHQVTIATCKVEGRHDGEINGVFVKQFDIKGNLVHGISGEVDRYREFILKQEYDVMCNFAMQQWASDLVLDLLDNIGSKKVSCPTGFSGLRLKEYKEYFSNMPDWLNKYDANIFQSNIYQDVTFARTNKVKNITIIPNGADEKLYDTPVEYSFKKKNGLDMNTFLILHAGNHTNAKGHREAIQSFVKANISNSVFVLTGKSTVKLSLSLNPLKSLRSIVYFFRNNCEWKCKLRAKLANFYFKIFNKKKRIILTYLHDKLLADTNREADLFLFPSNIEASPLVLYEANASHTAFLSSDVGNASEVASWTGGGMIIPTTKSAKGYATIDINACAKMIERLYNDRKLLQKLSNKGYEQWKNFFTWDKISSDYEKLYLSLVNSNSKNKL